MSEVADKVYTEQELEQLDKNLVPHHVAIIMDGNRRWAEDKGLSAAEGHFAGSYNLVNTVEAAANLGIKVLTVYSFSTENWRRPKEEVEALWRLFVLQLQQQHEGMLEKGVRLEMIGDLSQLPQDVSDALKASREATKNCDTITLVLAVNYGGRDELCRAADRMIKDVTENKVVIPKVTEELFSNYLDTASWSDPDLLIRTSGEKRISNFLLWQLSYAEFYLTDVLWPDFNAQELLKAIKDYQRRRCCLGG